MKQPTVSVAMAVYNSDRYLKEAIESILGQTFSDFEFLIIDDGSTDNSLAIIQEYAKRDSRIRLTICENRGIPKTRNEMLSQAMGEFIAVMDADDIALPNRFARQVEFLRQNSDVVCVGGAIDWIDETGGLLGHCPMPQSDEELQNLLLGGVSLLHHPTTMIRRTAMVEVGGYDETMVGSCDLDLWLKLGEVGKLANLPETVLLYRLHKQSITQAKQTRQSDDALAACQRAWQRRGIQGSFFRKPADHLHQYEFWISCGRSSFFSGRRDAAMRCGMRAVSLKPLAISGWKLIVRALLQPLPRSHSL